MLPASILFVCLGNICRSPSAQAVMTQLSKNQGFDIDFDSAGTANYHCGNPPDERALAVGQSLGYDLSNLRARQVCHDDFYEFDFIFAMDVNNLTNLQKMMPSDATAQVLMFDERAVHDPYYGNIHDFQTMFAHIEQASRYWLNLWHKEMTHE
ncbi:low molecular weight protein-tyrosine-phosphatase [Moraxella oculi]|uniref:protein-tyrosine-phosphatase n=1 Tax=Moraxella oculi TaxID=2940516 RepID=A0ABW8U621_9GAMM